jgi:hypothetical protein
MILTLNAITALNISHNLIEGGTILETMDGWIILENK